MDAENIIEIISERYQKLYDKYLKIVGEHIKDIGKATHGDINKMVQLQRLNLAMSRLNLEYSEISKKNYMDILKFYNKLATENYLSYAPAYEKKGLKIGEITDNAMLIKQINAIGKTALDEFKNISNTTVLKRLYQNAVDEASLAIVNGLTTYKSAIRHTIKDTAVDGNQVVYKSGNRRRRDTAVRMNVLESANRINQEVALATGKEFGADGVEIEAHSLCALDHIDIQGRQYTKKEYEKLQNTLKRPIGTLNCHHFAFPILMEMSPANTPKDLEKIKKTSTEEITVGGVRKTRYEWTQEQRRIETNIRRQKDIANIAKASGDNALRVQAQAEINKLTLNYKILSMQTGLRIRLDKTVVSNFRPVKT